jgi:nucleotide-binding universal stress UspA family protein
VYKRALVPLDGSNVAEGIIPFVLEIAGALDMEVVLLRVLLPIPPSVVEGTRYVEVEDVEKRRVEAEEYLAPVAAELRAKGVRTTTMVRRGEPVDEILTGARASGADLIAMTTHGRSGLGRLLFGSVAEAVLRRSEIPVFLMRQTEFQVAARAAWEALRWPVAFCTLQISRQRPDRPSRRPWSWRRRAGPSSPLCTS